MDKAPETRKDQLLREQRELTEKIARDENIKKLSKQETDKQAEIETLKTTNPGDQAGLDKFFLELKTIREEARKITGKKEGEKPITIVSPVEIPIPKEENPAAASILDTGEKDSKIKKMETRPHGERDEATRPHRREREENLESVPMDLSTINQGFWGRMSEGAKRIAGKAYENLDKITGVSVVVGKLEIAYNQSWADRHEEKAIKFKGKMDNFDGGVRELDRAIKEIESIIEDMRRDNIPGTESLELKLKVLELKKAELLKKGDKVQSKFESRQNKNKLYTNKRDQIADRLIEKYDERLDPMEKELERLQTCRDEADLLAAVTEAKNNELSLRIKTIGERKTQIEEALRRTGMKEGKIKKFEAVKALEELIIQCKRQINTRKEEIQDKKAAIDEQVAKTDKKANPYRDKREQFIRVKNRRPIDIEAPERERSQVFAEQEEIKSHIRRESSKTVNSGGGTEEITGSNAPDHSGFEESETEETEERASIADLITHWNNLVRTEGKNSKFLINERDFLQATRASGISRNTNFSQQDFENIIKKYYKLKKIK